MCTHKANGEAAHFSARWIKDRFVVFAGSKNVHMAVRSAADVEKYKDGRFLIARNVASSVLEMLAELPEEKASLLLSFMHHAQVGYFLLDSKCKCHEALDHPLMT